MVFVCFVFHRAHTLFFADDASKHTSHTRLHITHDARRGLFQKTTLWVVYGAW